MRIEAKTHRLESLICTLDQATNYFLVFTGLFIPLSITATDLSMAITAILGVLSGRFFRHLDVLKNNKLTWCALAMVLLVLLSAFWSIAPWADRLSALHKYSKLLYIPFLLAVCTNPKWRDRTIIAFLLGVFITVILSYLKAWAGLHIGNSLSPASVFYTHIETSFLVAFGAYLLALYAWQKPRWRILCLALVALFTYQEFFINDGRTGWVAYFILMILFAGQFIGWKGLLMGVAIAALLPVIFYYVSPTFRFIVNDSVQQIKQYQAGQVQTSIGYRLSFDSLSWRLIQQQPLFGHGSGSFKTVYAQSGGVPGWKELVTPHNEYLMILVEFGVAGLLLLLLFFYYQIRESFHLGEMKFFAQGLILIFMISSFYNAFLYLTVSGHFYMLFTALFYGVSQEKKQNIYARPGLLH
jgi:O-antigen ligase